MISCKKLVKLARLIRSKNAGPFCVTFDIMFANDADFERVVSESTNKKLDCQHIPSSGRFSDFRRNLRRQCHQIFISTASNSRRSWRNRHVFRTAICTTVGSRCQIIKNLLYHIRLRPGFQYGYARPVQLEFRFFHLDEAWYHLYE